MPWEAAGFEVLLEELENALGHLVGLGQHGLGGLDEDIVLGVGHHLVGDVGVPDGGLGVLDVLGHNAQVVDGVLQAVLGGAQGGAHLVDFLDGFVDGGDGSRSGSKRSNSSVINPQLGGVQIADREAQLVSTLALFADLQGNGGIVEKLLAVEVAVGTDAVDLLDQLLELLIQVAPVLLGIGAVGGLGGQLHHTVEHIVDLSQGALSTLHHGDTVLGVLLGHGQAGDLGAHLLRNGQTGGVVAGAVDLVAGGQLLQVLGESGGVGAVVAVGIHRHNIVLDTHEIFLLICFV